MKTFTHTQNLILVGSEKTNETHTKKTKIHFGVVRKKKEERKEHKKLKGDFTTDKNN